MRTDGDNSHGAWAGNKGAIEQATARLYPKCRYFVPHRLFCIHFDFPTFSRFHGRVADAHPVGGYGVGVGTRAQGWRRAITCRVSCVPLLLVLRLFGVFCGKNTSHELSDDVGVARSRAVTCRHGGGRPPWDRARLASL